MPLGYTLITYLRKLFKGKKKVKIIYGSNNFFNFQ